MRWIFLNILFSFVAIQPVSFGEISAPLDLSPGNYRRCLTYLLKRPDDALEVITKAITDFEKEQKNILSFPDRFQISQNFSETYQLPGFERPPPTPEEYAKLDIPQEIKDHYDFEAHELKLPKRDPVFFSSESGAEKLKAIRIAVSGTGKETRYAWTMETLHDYLLIMDRLPDTSLFVSADEKLQPQINRLLQTAPRSTRNRVHLLKDGDSTDAVVWTQDGSKPAISSNPKTVVTAPIEGKTKEYRRLLQEYENAKIVELEHSPLFFQGGNVVVGNQNVFVGTDVTSKIMSNYRIGRKNALALMEQEWGRPIIEIGNTRFMDSAIPYQPDFHIDLTMAAVFNPKTKKETILLGSADEFFKEIRDMKAKDFVTQTELDIFNVLRDSDRVKNLAWRELQIKNIKQHLESKGFEVKLIPNLSYGSRDARPVVNYTAILGS